MDRNSKEFKDLQAKWYKKLKDKGFDDIEQDEDHLKLWSAHFFKARHNATLFEAKEAYYRLAGHFLWEHKFTSDLHKLIWKMHADGLSIMQITQTLKDKGHKTHKNGVHKITQELSRAMLKKHGQQSNR